MRHCEAVGQAPEDSLTVQGQEDTARLIDFFRDKDIEMIISSPFVRTIETINPFANTIEKDILIDERLKERVQLTWIIGWRIWKQLMKIWI
ncbi:Histidine phosphatase superfamily [compost metagenome]